MTDYSRFLGDDTVAIFLFHGVIRRPRHAVRNYTRKHLPVGDFLTVLDELCAAGVPVSIPELVAATRDGKSLPRRAFAVTFDDGFENNFSVVAPILTARGVPATFYVTTGFVGGNGCSWIDRIEYAVEATAAFELALPFDDQPRRYETPEQKRGLLETIRAVVKGDRTVDPEAVADEVWRQLGVTGMALDPELDRKLSWAQVRELARHPLFTVGGHGHTHRILEYLDQSDLEREVALSIEKLRANLAVPVEHYSYPEGLATCYSERVIRTLKAHGIVCAPTAEPGTNRPGDDLFRLRRVMVA